jgi:hypothetical protein
MLLADNHVQDYGGVEIYRESLYFEAAPTQHRNSILLLKRQNAISHRRYDYMPISLVYSFEKFLVMKIMVTI